MSPSPGKFVWYELNTTDMDAAIRFYGQVVGWTFDGATTGPQAYPHIRDGQGHLGGLMQLPEPVKAMGVPPYWVGYVEVANVDETLVKLKALGGAVHFGPMDLPGTGRFAAVADPQGAAFAIHQPEKPSAPRDARQPGAFNWHELATSDPTAAFTFYTALFGWQKLGEMDMGPMGTYLLFGMGDVQMGGMFRRPPEMPVSAWLYYIMVADLDAALQRAKDAGGKLLNGPMPVPGGARIVQMQDPQGAMFALVGQ